MTTETDVQLGARRSLCAATALLMRELVCEQIYRSRDRWNIEHPNRALGVRDIHPDHVADAAHVYLLLRSNKELRELAAQLLDVEPSEWPKMVDAFLSAPPVSG